MRPARWSLTAGILLAAAAAWAGSTTTVKRGSQNGLDINRAMNTGSVWERLDNTRPWMIPGRQLAPIARIIDTGAPADRDTCDEACAAGNASPLGVMARTCIDATACSAAGACVDSTCATAVGGAGTIQICQCDEDINNHWTVVKSADVVETLGCGSGSHFVGGDVECFTAAATGSFFQGQWTSADESSVAGEGDQPPAGFPQLVGTNPAVFWFEWNGGVTDASQTVAELQQLEFFIGMASQDNSANGLTDGGVDYIGFRKRDVDDDASNAIYFVTSSNGNTAAGDMIQNNASSSLNATGWTVGNTSCASQAACDAVKDIWSDGTLRLTFSVQPSTQIVHAYINGQEVTGSPFILTNKLPDTNTSISFYILSGDTVALTQKAVSWKYIWLATGTTGNVP